MVANNRSQTGAQVAACEHNDVCEVLSCELCLLEIPTSVAKSYEGPDYVHHFCGLECLEKWHAKHKDETKSP